MYRLLHKMQTIMVSSVCGSINMSVAQLSHINKYRNEPAWCIESRKRRGRGQLNSHNNVKERCTQLLPRSHHTHTIRYLHCSLVSITSGKTQQQTARTPAQWHSRGAQPGVFHSGFRVFPHQPKQELKGSIHPDSRAETELTTKCGNPLSHKNTMGVVSDSGNSTKMVQSCAIIPGLWGMCSRCAQCSLWHYKHIRDQLWTCDYTHQIIIA